MRDATRYKNNPFCVDMIYCLQPQENFGFRVWYIERQKEMGCWNLEHDLCVGVGVAWAALL